MSVASKKNRKEISEGTRRSKREYAVRYYAERDYRKDDAAGGVNEKLLKNNWKHVVSYSMSEGDLAQKLSTSVTYIRYLRRKVAICQKNGVTRPDAIYKLAAGVGEKSLKAYFKSGGKKTAKKAAKKSMGKVARKTKKTAKKSAKKTAKKSARKSSKKSAKKSSKKKTSRRR